MRLANGVVKAALDALGALCGPGNRLPVVAMLKADRNLRALSRAWEPCEVVRLKLLEEHGKLRADRTGYEFADRAGAAAFTAAYNAMAAEETEIAIEPITPADIAAGYHKDPETGQKSPVLDLDGEQLALLITLGIVGDGPPKLELMEQEAAS